MGSRKSPEVSSPARDDDVAVAALRYAAIDVRTAAREAPTHREMLDHLAELISAMANSLCPVGAAASGQTLRKPRAGGTRNR
ncbi:MAG: hypothetical protein ABT940_11880 [Alphaproteobacteria bacterium]